VLAVARQDGVALAPSSDGAGTNALWRSPPGSIPPAFGPGSRAAHERLAMERGVPVRVVVRAGLALDVDEPRDLRAAWDTGPGPRTRLVLEEMGFATREVS
jgi:2-phospho-L-lactate guanylyltransferase